MASIIKQPWVERTTYYELVFDDGENNGFAFPCNKDGELLPTMSECALKNYTSCMEHPETFVRFNEVIEYTDRHHHGATIRCKCGNKFELQNEVDGACMCEKCNQWYNLFGQELLPPEQWGDNYDDFYGTEWGDWT